MSEDAAYRRSKAARLVREYPELRDAVAKGEIHVTGVLMIGPHLGGERHAEVLRRARFRSKRELLRLVAQLDPRPEVPTLVEPIGPERAGVATHRAQVEALAGPVRELQLGRRPEDWMDGDVEDSVDVGTSGDQPDTPEPDRPLRYRVQFTASQEFVDLLNEACDLLSHESPRPSVPDVQLRAMRALVKQLRARKRAATDRPRSVLPGRDRKSDVAKAEQNATAPARVPSTAKAAPARSLPVANSAATPASRHVPAAVRRAVWDRDRARCAYIDDRDERCRETSSLEIHHRHAHSLGGLATLGNLELRCRAHNTLAAEQDFGREQMDWMRGVSKAAPARVDESG
jgi:5-methylcytosine-specific restriction endonuclease McrA